MTLLFSKVVKVVDILMNQWFGELFVTHLCEPDLRRRSLAIGCVMLMLHTPLIETPLSIWCNRH